MLARKTWKRCEKENGKTIRQDFKTRYIGFKTSAIGTTNCLNGHVSIETQSPYVTQLKLHCLSIVVKFSSQSEYCIRQGETNRHMK